MSAKPERAEASTGPDFAVSEAAASEPGLFEALYPQLRRFAAVVADLDVDPDDLVQDALCSALRRHDLSELDNPAAYLKRAMVNAVASDRRRKGTLKRLLPRLAADAQTEDRYPSDLSDLDALDPLDRAVLFMVDVEGVAHEAVATELGLTNAAVRKRASRARARMRASLRPSLTVITKEES